MSRRRWGIVNAAWRGWVESMIPKEEQLRAAIADQAGEWFVVNDEGPLDLPNSIALAAWLKASPVHIEEFLGVSVIARDMRELGADSEFSLQTVVSRAQAEADSAARPLWSRVIGRFRRMPSRRWLVAAAAITAIVVVGLGLLFSWNVRSVPHVQPSGAAIALHLETRHGEQLVRPLADNSVLHLNTDSAVTIRYSNAERLVTLDSGQADFEVAHEPDRAFRVLAGSAEVIAVGTRFDVRLEHEATVVTVVEGRVAVGPSPLLEKTGANSSLDHPPRFVQVGANQQIRAAAGEWPAMPATVDAQRITAWLQRQIVFDEEPLEHVAAEFNRYTQKPIEIATPGLRNLQISGVFATDDPEAFIAFLRSLKGVRVEVTATKIRISQDPDVSTPDYT
jgi:transmembrane sensor